jgi:LAO/AO transport system ATPase
MAPREQKPSALAADIRTGDRATLARAITLIESKRSDHRKQAHLLVQELLPATGKAIRLGITGAPGSGKSTTIDALGTFLTGKGHKVAVLAVDPSSTRTGGSILGDKTRMARLAVDPLAFVRPSPSSGTLGGVAAKTRETMLLCEAAGYDVVLVETVGIGQSETTVADMTDFFLVLMIPGAGDELQGLKKGIVELADMIAVNKADGDNVARARLAAADYRAAQHPGATLADLVAAGAHLFGAHRRRRCAAVGADRRAQGEDDGLRRTRRAPPRAAGQVDVVDAGGAHDGAAAQRCVRAWEAQGRGSCCRRRQARTDVGGGADRRAVGGVA